MLEGICILLFSLFAYTAINKIYDIHHILIVMPSYPLIKPISSWLPFVIIAVEIGLAMLLLWPGKRGIALYGSFVVMFAFTAYVIILLSTASYLPCTCGGIVQKLTWKQHLYVNFAFLILAFMGIVLWERKGGEKIVATISHD
jgi:hypothetical protein